MAAAKGLETFRAELGTNPRVHCKNLYRWISVFASGSVAFAGTGEYAERAEVTAEARGTGGEGLLL